MVYKVLGKLFWKGDLRGVELLIIHRGAPHDMNTIQGSNIVQVKKSYIIYKNALGDETVIPLHRILEVRLNRKTVWKRECRC